MRAVHVLPPRVGIAAAGAPIVARDRGVNKLRGIGQRFIGQFCGVPGSRGVSGEVRMPTNQPRELADSAEGGG
jgi:hypothetical protein